MVQKFTSYTLIVPPSVVNDVNFWTMGIFVQKGAYAGGVWTQDPGTPTGNPQQWATPGSSVSNIWVSYVPAANDPYPSYQVYVAARGHGDNNGSPTWVTQTGNFSSTIYNQSFLLAGSNATSLSFPPTHPPSGNPEEPGTIETVTVTDEPQARILTPGVNVT